MDEAQVLNTQRKSWNDFSTGWLKWDALIMEWLRAAGEQMIEDAHLKDGDHVLDAATGTGEPGVLAAQKFPHITVVGTDVAEDMVAIANARAKERGVNNFTAEVAASAALPFPNNTFDAVLSRYGVIFAHDVSADVRELTRVLKPSGRMALAAWAEPADNPWATTVPKILSELAGITPPPLDAPGIFRCSKPDSLSSVMSEVGLQDVTVADVTGTVVFEDPEHYWNFLLEIAAPIAGALKQLDAETVAAVRAKTLTTIEGFRKDGRISLPYHARVTSGTKR